MARHLFPCGRTRREFVWEMGGGFASLALAHLLAADGFALGRSPRSRRTSRRRRRAASS